MSDLLLFTLLVALSAAALPPVVRALPWVQRQLEAGIKPWACDLCMSFWSTLAAGAVWWSIGHAPALAIWPAFVITYAIVRHNSGPLGPPPKFELPKDLDGGV